MRPVVPSRAPEAAVESKVVVVAAVAAARNSACKDIVKDRSRSVHERPRRATLNAMWKSVEGNEGENKVNEEGDHNSSRMRRSRRLRGSPGIRAPVGRKLLRTFAVNTEVVEGRSRLENLDQHGGATRGRGFRRFGAEVAGVKLPDLERRKSFDFVQEGRNGIRIRILKRSRRLSRRVGWDRMELGCHDAVN